MRTIEVSGDSEGMQEQETFLHGEPMEPEPRLYPFWIALAINGAAFGLGYLATFLSGAVTLGSAALVMFALTL